MSIDIATLGIIILSCLLGSIGQVFLKTGLLNEKPEISIRLVTYLFKPNIFIGAVLYAIAFLLWLVVLSRLELSRAYPFLALNFVFVQIFSFFLLGETITLGKIVGNTFIILGILLITILK